MNVSVHLRWSEGDPSMDVTSIDGGIVAIIDPRLSQHQVKAACDALDSHGAEVYAAWQRAVGLSDAETLAR